MCGLIRLLIDDRRPKVFPLRGLLVTGIPRYPYIALTVNFKRIQIVLVCLLFGSQTRFGIGFTIIVIIVRKIDVLGLWFNSTQVIVIHIFGDPVFVAAHSDGVVFVLQR